MEHTYEGLDLALNIDDLRLTEGKYGGSNNGSSMHTAILHRPANCICRRLLSHYGPDAPTTSILQVILSIYMRLPLN